MAIRVCVFDDHKNVRDALGIIMNGIEGFVWAGAFADAKNALADIKNAKPDVVLMDIEMPGISGIEAVKNIHEQYPDLKIIMQTMYEDDDKVFQSICFGASGYLLKSTSPAQILEAIKEVYSGGAPMNPHIARKVISFFQKHPPAKITDTDNYALSKREIEVLDCLVKGYSYKMIAAELTIHYDTVHSHIRKIYDKLHVASKSEAVAKAIKEHLV